MQGRYRQWLSPRPGKNTVYSSLIVWTEREFIGWDRGTRAGERNLRQREQHEIRPRGVA